MPKLGIQPNIKVRDSQGLQIHKATTSPPEEEQLLQKIKFDKAKTSCSPTLSPSPLRS